MYIGELIDEYVAGPQELRAALALLTDEVLDALVHEPPVRRLPHALLRR